MEKVIFLIIVYFLESAEGLCFFPAEYQGIFAAQSDLTQEKRHLYSRITILPDAIPIWGVCESRAGNTVILHDSTGGKECVRCFHLYLRSPNLIQVYTEALDRCYDNKELARQSCPSMNDIRASTAREILLYKIRSFTEDGRISRETCPFVGRFHFSYGAFDGKRRNDMCLDTSSTLSTCPRASQLKLNFRACTFGNLDLHLECLGAWTGFDDITYVALFDPDVKSDTQPRYRCGMYHKSPSGRVALSLSADSSCHNQLISPWQGFESLNLMPFRPPSPPSAVFETSCTFPEWVQGEWQNIKFTGNQFEYRDETADQVHTGLCLSEEAPLGERFSVYSINQCGREMFACIWLKSRSHNVLEFILTSGENFHNATALCSDDQMWKRSWLTQGRKIKAPSSCPISGEFVGVLPDDRTLCAKLSSDCDRPDFMHHTVFPCTNDTIPYEDVNAEESKPKASYSRNRRSLYENYALPQVIRRRRSNTGRSQLTSPPWKILGSSEDKDRLYILSSEPIRHYGDSRGKRVYVFEGGLDPPPDQLNQPARIGRRTTNFEEDLDPIRDRVRVDIPGGDWNYGDNVVNDNGLSRELHVAPGKETERYYQCLGQWKEGGVTYIYTWRRDVFQHECFAGVEVSQDQVFLLEAGPTCRRGFQPLAEGMKITKKNACSDNQSKTFGRENSAHSAYSVSNRVEGYDSSHGARWRFLGESHLPLFSSGGFSVHLTGSSLSIFLSLMIRFNA